MRTRKTSIIVKSDFPSGIVKLPCQQTVSRPSAGMYCLYTIILCLHTVYRTVGFSVHLYQNNLLRMRPIGKMTRGSYNIRACTTRIYVAFYVYSLRTFILTPPFVLPIATKWSDRIFIILSLQHTLFSSLAVGLLVLQLLFLCQPTDLHL